MLETQHFHVERADRTGFVVVASVLLLAAFAPDTMVGSAFAGVLVASALAFAVAAMRRTSLHVLVDVQRQELIIRRKSLLSTQERSVPRVQIESLNCVVIAAATDGLDASVGAPAVKLTARLNSGEVVDLTSGHGVEYFPAAAGEVLLTGPPFQLGRALSVALAIPLIEEL